MRTRTSPSISTLAMLLAGMAVGVFILITSSFALHSGEHPDAATAQGLLRGAALAFLPLQEKATAVFDGLVKATVDEVDQTLLGDFLLSLPHLPNLNPLNFLPPLPSPPLPPAHIQTQTQTQKQTQGTPQLSDPMQRMHDFGFDFGHLLSPQFYFGNGA
jgi:hypothetical protein